MKRRLLRVLFTMLLQLFMVSGADAAAPAQASLLEQRAMEWPEWSLPAPLPRPRARQDLIYPDWFAGDWQVQSDTLDRNGLRLENESTLLHRARFKRNQAGQLVGDRPFNATAIGKALLGDKLLSVDQDPERVNRQLARLSGDVLLETSVIGRRQAVVSTESGTEEFLSDELVLQIVHGPGAPRLSRIETLTRYEQCGSEICGDQRQVSYGAPGLQTDQSLAGRSSRFRLVLTRLPQDPAE